MKRIQTILLFLLATVISLTGCSSDDSKKSDGYLTLGLLRGVSAVPFAEWFDQKPVLNGKTIEIRLLDSPEMILSAMSNKEVDIGVIPIISAINSYNSGMDIKLLGCPIWGSVYLLGRKDSISAADMSDLYLLGVGSKPDMLSKRMLDYKSLSYKLNYTMSSPDEIANAVKSQNIDLAMCAEPFASLLLSGDSTLRVLADLNTLSGSEERFPQTAIICPNNLTKYSDDLNSLIKKSCDFSAKNPQMAIEILENHGVIRKNILSSLLFERCKIYYQPANKIIDDVNNYMETVFEVDPKTVYHKNRVKNDFYN